jgi:hypothetical protein
MLFSKRFFEGKWWIYRIFIFRNGIFKINFLSFSRQTRGKAAKLLQYFISNLSCSKRQSAEDYLSAEDSTLKLNLLEDHATHAKTLADWPPPNHKYEFFFLMLLTSIFLSTQHDVANPANKFPQLCRKSKKRTQCMIQTIVIG